jgi:hypothetical protein
VRLQFDITKSGTVVAKPLLRIPLGEAGSLRLDAVSFSVVPTRTDSGDLALQFDFKDGPKPRIVLKGDDGSGEISLEKDKLNVKVSRVK